MFKKKNYSIFFTFYFIFNIHILKSLKIIKKYYFEHLKIEIETAPDTPSPWIQLAPEVPPNIPRIVYINILKELSAAAFH